MMLTELLSAGEESKLALIAQVHAWLASISLTASTWAKALRLVAVLSIDCAFGDASLGLVCMLDGVRCLAKTAGSNAIAQPVRLEFLVPVREELSVVVDARQRTLSVGGAIVSYTVSRAPQAQDLAAS